MPNTNRADLVDALARALGNEAGSFSRPGSDDYEQINNSYFSAFENELRPSYIVRPSTVEQVRALLDVLRPHALSGSCRIAIRGEGITLSDGKSAVEIVTGETWTTVYAELDKHGLTVTGGRVGRIGVAGFILGGGLSLFSTRMGFACDSVIEFKVVLASGQLVRASADENADLWIALKGGLNNFGIVTSITMKTFQRRDIWGGVTYYMPGTFSQILQTACDFVQNEPDEDVQIMCSAGYGYGHQAVTCIMYHTQGKVNPPSLQPFTAVQPQIEQMGTMRTATHTDFYGELSKFTSDGMRQYYASITIKPDIALMEAFHNKWQETLATIQDAEGLVFSFGFHPLTKALLANSARAGGNAMNIPPSDGPLFIILINPCWTQPRDDSRIFAAVEAMLAEFRRLAREKELLHRYIFTNYAYHKDDVLAGYGEESLARLRVVRRTYDPEGLFQTCVSGAFKLGV
ncbi:FAD-binding domain-containing protein [Parathielavia appendiculata]|uniref:FAD-binding domain-containing protein n=1 Tax=Parathielavia appendiculata TaxID=2587402 RepID=A0AAN6TUG3_9PEZI|nr:FAD-binding domain-containing protein [Parathielavia appendiculata]